MSEAIRYAIAAGALRLADTGADAAPIDPADLTRGWDVEGLAATWGRDAAPNRHREVWSRKAFDRALEAFKAGTYRPKMTDAHQRVVGVWTSMKRTSGGLLVRGRISRTTAGHDLRLLVIDRAVDSLSVGFIHRDVGVIERAGEELLEIRDADLVEVALTGTPSDVGARITAHRTAAGARPAAPPPTAPDLAGLLARLEASNLRLLHQRHRED